MLRALLAAVAVGVISSGCTTTRTSDTARTGLEQLLISNSIDQSLNKLDFQPSAGSVVFVQDKYLDSVDKNYIVASVRQRVLASGARLAAKPEDADVVVEVFSGGVGTDNKETFVGIPELAVPAPLPVQFPEVRLLTRSKQIGTAKIGLVTYDAKTGGLMGDGRVALARSDDSNWFVMGLGPFNRGTVRDELIAATEPAATPASYDVQFNEEPGVIEKTRQAVFENRVIERATRDDTVIHSLK